MTVHLILSGARKSPDRSNAGRWYVLHPSNDAILASCDTEEEAERTVVLLDAFCSAPAHNPQSFGPCSPGSDPGDDKR